MLTYKETLSSVMSMFPSSMLEEALAQGVEGDFHAKRIAIRNTCAVREGWVDFSEAITTRNLAHIFWKFYEDPVIWQLPLF